ncbi:MAG: flavodoxin family protein [Christensenellales bacterium]|jgi:flavodoxin
MKSAIFYFSLDGSARCAAEALSRKWAADVIELAEAKPRGRGKWDFVKAVFQALRGAESRLALNVSDAARPYDKVYIISPVWAGRTVPAVNACLAQCDFTGKQVGILSVQADRDLKGADEVLDSMARRVEAARGQVVFRHALVGALPGKTISREDMERQINEIFDDVR